MAGVKANQRALRNVRRLDAGYVRMELAQQQFPFGGTVEDLLATTGPFHDAIEEVLSDWEQDADG